MLRWLCVVVTVLYISIFLYNSLTRTRLFTPDSMNYADVAQNIVQGRGIVQSTIGFNQPLLFTKDSQIPAPFISQPPLYPILIAVLHYLGPSYADAALIVPVIAYIFIFIMTYLVARNLYGINEALLSVAALFLYIPIVLAAKTAWTETVGMVFLLLSFLFLAKATNAVGSSASMKKVFIGGLSVGFACSTRYAFILLALLGVVFLIFEIPEKRRKIQTVLLYLLGVGIPTVPVFVRNLLTAGHLFPAALPSNQSLRVNINDMFFSLFGNYLSIEHSKIQAFVLVTAVVVIVIIMALRKRINELFNVFIFNKSYILTMWIVVYSVFICYKRTISHFDPIDYRLIVPAGIVMLIVGMALAVKSLSLEKLKSHMLYGVIIAAAAIGITRELHLTLTQPYRNMDTEIAQSPRLSWIARNTTDNDLIIGDDAIDVPFYFGRRSAASFSPYPYTIHLSYNNLMEYIQYNCHRYEHIYLVLRRYANWSYDEYVRFFGKFIADIEKENLDEYAGIYPVYSYEDSLIYEVLCQKGH